MSALARVHLGRSAGARAFLALVVLAELHIFGRSRLWVHEWLWALYQYHFVTVILGPPAAGVAAWEGQRVARASDVSAAAGTTLRAAVMAWAGVYAWVLLAYGVGLLTVVTLVRGAGTPGWPDAASLATVGPPIVLLAAETAAGFVIGRLVRSPLAPPGVAVGCFLVILLFYIAGPAHLVDVGGAGNPMLGHQLRPDLLAAQILLYLSLTLAAFSALVWTRNSPGVIRVGAMVVGLGLVAVALGNLLGQGPDKFRRVDATLLCVGTRPQVCVGPGYAPMASHIRAMLLPYLEELRAAGVPVPERFSMTAHPGEATAPLEGVVFALLRYGERYAEEAAAAQILGWYVRPTCDLFRKPASTAFDGVLSWLGARVYPERVVVPPRPRVLSQGALEEQRAWIRDAVRVLMACGR
jgi:hypothetical protein